MLKYLAVQSLERLLRNERLMYLLENRGMVATYQRRFSKGRSTMDPVSCWEDEIRKAQVNKVTVVAVLFDVEKALDMFWREALLIKIHLRGIVRKMLIWVMDFLDKGIIQVKIGWELRPKPKCCRKQVTSGAWIKPNFIFHYEKLYICKYSN